MSDIKSRVQDDFAERLNGKSGSAGDLRHEIEHLEHDFDYDNYAPYTSQEEETIRELEAEYWQDAQELADQGETLKPSEWEEGRRVYAGWLAYCAYSQMWEEVKTELIEAVEQFESDAGSIGCFEPVISLSTSCIHGWASHDREDAADGVMFFESRQLDGCNGLAYETSGIWLSCCFDPGVDGDERSYGPLHTQRRLPDEA